MQRLPLLDTRLVRAGIAVALAAVTALEAWTWAPDADEVGEPLQLGTRAMVTAVMTGFALSLALPARLRPVTLALAAPAAWLAFAGPIDTSIGLTLGLGTAVFLAAAEATSGTGATAVGAGALVIAVAGAVGHPAAVAEAGDMLVLGAAIGGPWLAGSTVQLRRRLESRLLDAATADERARIARELHDVVAHAISVIVIQARGGRRAVEREPSAAIAAFDAIDTTAAAAMAEMRRLLGVLRPDSDVGALEPQPGLASLDRLLVNVRAAGLPVELRVEGEPAVLPPGVDLAAYRVVQEALTNTLRHAGAALTRVFVRYGRGEVEIEVRDDGAADAHVGARGGGRGMVGMRERTALYGGSLRVGPVEGGGYAVIARLPYGPGSEAG